MRGMGCRVVGAVYSRVCGVNRGLFRAWGGNCGQMEYWCVFCRVRASYIY